MIRLVSLARVKHWLNVIHDHDDAKLNFAILAASRAVMDYLELADSDIEMDSDGAQIFDSNDDPEGVPEIEQVATAILVGKMYDGVDPKALEYGRLPIEVTSLLYIRKRQMGIA